MSRVFARAFHASARRPQIYQNILQIIGKTPIVKINKLSPEGRTIYAKCEFFNPLSSVKDRLALAIIEDAERNGTLKPGQTVIDGSSGNTGIALAMVCAQKGYPCVVTMAESFSIERRKIMRFLGAKVILTPAPMKGTGMLNKAKELADAHGWFLARQFENEANARFHASTTGAEIVSDFASQRLDYWITGYGTGGTLKGVGQILRVAKPNTKIIVAEPAPAALLSSRTKTTRDKFGAPTESHPAFSPHPIQGWTPDFISKLTEDAQNMELIDEVMTVAPADAIATARKLGSMEGIFTGISGGATMATAIKVAAAAPEGSVILTMLADTAERYLSTPLFADIEANMNETELELSKSTPNCHIPPPAQ